jgi:polyisoprenoid-binding protein YceI
MSNPATKRDDAATPQVGRYEIEPNGSSVSFKTRHIFGIAPVHGTLAIRRGTLDVAEPLADSSVYAEIDTGSFDSGNPMRDHTVGSPRLLDANRYPAIAFRADGVEDGRLVGTLTVRDVTEPVTLSIAQYSASPGSLTARATTRIDRRAFGVTAFRGLAARYLDISVEVHCVRTQVSEPRT